MSDHISRYERQYLAPRIGGEQGQKNLCQKTVLLIGAGGVGGPLVMYLAGAGIKRLIICDFDNVSLSNIHRQVVYTESDVDSSLTKAQIATQFASKRNSGTEFIPVEERLDCEGIVRLIKQYHPDVVADCTDNVPTRYAASDACVQEKVPLLSISALRTEGQYAWFCRSPIDGSVLPCRRCISAPPARSLTAATSGVVGTSAASIACMAATELLIALTGAREGISAGSLCCLIWTSSGPRVQQMKLRPA